MGISTLYYEPDASVAGLKNAFSIIYNKNRIGYVGKRGKRWLGKSNDGLLDVSDQEHRWQVTDTLIQWWRATHNV